ncbi:type VII secretion target [Kitasatospora sp. NPDC054939]
MAQEVRVDPGVLENSAKHAGDISNELRPLTGKAATESGEAAGSLNGWSIAGELVQTQSTWQQAFQLVHGRLDAAAGNLRTTAGNYRSTEQANAQSMQAGR